MLVEASRIYGDTVTRSSTRQVFNNVFQCVTLHIVGS